MTPGSVSSHFNEYKIEALRTVCRATGESLKGMTVKQAKTYLRLFYSLPHEDRSEPRSYLAQARMVAMAASVLCRYEFGSFGDWPDQLDEAERRIQQAISFLQTASRELSHRRLPKREG